MTNVRYVEAARVKTKVVTALTVLTQPTTQNLLTTLPVPTRRARLGRESRRTYFGMQVEQTVRTVRSVTTHPRELVSVPISTSVRQTHVKTTVRAQMVWVRIIAPVSLVILAKTVYPAQTSTTILTVVTYAATTLVQCAPRAVLEKGKRHRALLRQTVCVLKTSVLVPMVLL